MRNVQLSADFKHYAFEIKKKEVIRKVVNIDKNEHHRWVGNYGFVILRLQNIFKLWRLNNLWAQKCQLWFITYTKCPQTMVCTTSQTSWIKATFTWGFPFRWMIYNWIQHLSVLCLIWVTSLGKTSDRKITKGKCKILYISHTEY